MWAPSRGGTESVPTRMTLKPRKDVLAVHRTRVRLRDDFLVYQKMTGPKAACV